jgi:rhamnulokinase
METLPLTDRAIVDFAPKLIVAADGEPAVSSMDMIEAVIASGVAAERRRVPMNEARYLAFDLGAESGRAVVGGFDGKKLTLEEIHRFPNGPVAVHGHLHWDALRLFEEVRRSIQACAHRHRTIEGIGVNTWGVDFALLDRGGELLANPYCYRDPRTNGMMERVDRMLPRERLFELTGIQFMPINSLYQLVATSVERPALLDAASTFLMMPDLINYWLTGIKACEITDASTTQFFEARPRTWSKTVFDSLGLPLRILPDLLKPGTVVGPLLPSVSDAFTGVPVIAPASHDTASAAAAVPVRSTDSVFISSGTWSALGAEIAQPAITSESLRLNFTNECALEGRYLFRKNIMGLWLLQECRRRWAEEGAALEYDELIRIAARARPFGPVVEPDHGSFLLPGDMPKRIVQFCRSTGQEPPESRDAIVRCILESLALKYRWVLERLEDVLGIRAGVIHVVGGGSRNALLCQLTADATQRLVEAGPDEATASGNVIVQAIARGHLATLAEGREIIRSSYPLARYEPTRAAGWDDHYARFLRLKEHSSTLL